MFYQRINWSHKIKVICNMLKMKASFFRIILSLAGLCLGAPSICFALSGEIKVEAYYPVFPVLVEREYNIVCELSIDAETAGNTLQGLVLKLDELCLEAASDIRLMWSGTASVIRSKTSSIVLKEQGNKLAGGQMIWCNPDFVKKAGEASLNSMSKKREITIPCQIPLAAKRNYFYISIRFDPLKIKDLSDIVSVEACNAIISGREYEIKLKGKTERRLGASVRQSGDDGVEAYRIPGLVTSLKGTLIAVYDIRYNSSLDLQSNIDIGVSRSTDGGRTWGKMRKAMDMGEWGGLPQAMNGIGDPSVLVDEKTGEIFILALWTHDITGDRAWTATGQGMLPQETGQMMLCSSKDDGLTWSAPVNITSQIKNPEWYLTLQGPGRGITMADGTLVFPFQYIDSTRIPNAGIIYSKDRGKTWHKSVSAKSNTTEAQVAEISPGILMLNMRDNRGTGRAVAITKDMGLTWAEHPSSGALIESICMGSLLMVPAKNNVFGRDILLFSNPAVAKGRSKITIKASLDGGYTWPEANTLLLDEEELWGYSCLSMIDKETVGILYEGSAAQITFQAVKLKDIIKDVSSVLNLSPLLNSKQPGAKQTKGYSCGVSGAFIGKLNESGKKSGSVLVFAGGANFPDKALSQGGKKRYYSDITLISDKKETTAWLPEPLAYGASFCVGGKVLFAGGNNGEEISNRIYTLSLKGGKVSVGRCSPLPEAIEQFGAASENDTVYVLGGMRAVSGNKAESSAKAYKGVVKGEKIIWRALPDLPQPSVQGIAAVHKSVLYYWEGWNPDTGKTSSRGWKLIGNEWKSIAEIPVKRKSGLSPGTGVGASCIVLREGKVIVIGGVDPEVFEKGLEAQKKGEKSFLNMPPAHYGFCPYLRVYDISTDSWSDAGLSGKLSLAGASVIVDNDNLYVLNGEIKPGVRTSESYKIDLASIIKD